MTQAQSVNTEFWGVDGCTAGWILARKTASNGGLTFSVHSDWQALMKEADGKNIVVAVDMPIGLTDFGRRACDVLARQELGWPRASSVFAPPRRPMLQFETYVQANNWGKAQGPDGGGGLSKQAWNLVPKIRQIDHWIDPQKQQYVREAHPELAFQRLNKGNPLTPKRSPQGQSARSGLLEGAYRLAQSSLPEIPSSVAKLDDILDAAVLAWTAKRIADGQAACLPGNPQKDACGLNMEIWY